MHIIAAKAIAFKEAAEPSFVTYQQQVLDNCRTLAEELQANGIRVLSGGTDNHLLVIDLRPQDLTGRAVEESLDRVGITVSRSTIPADPKPPRVSSGVRVGTAAVTDPRLWPRRDEDRGQAHCNHYPSHGQRGGPEPGGQGGAGAVRRLPGAGHPHAAGRVQADGDGATGGVVPHSAGALRVCVSPYLR